jgi:hypothetical protein
MRPHPFKITPMGSRSRDCGDVDSGACLVGEWLTQIDIRHVVADRSERGNLRTLGGKLASSPRPHLQWPRTPETGSRRNRFAAMTMQQFSPAKRARQQLLAAATQCRIPDFLS